MKPCRSEDHSRLGRDDTPGVVLSSACTRRDELFPWVQSTGRDTNVNVSVSASGRAFERRRGARDVIGTRTG